MSLDGLNLADLGLPTAATEDQPTAITDPPETEGVDGEADENVELPDGEGEDQPNEPDPFSEYSDEVDIDGVKYRVPEKIRLGVMRMDDYTRKTQEVAATRRELDARAAEIDQRSKVSDEEIQARGAQFSIRSQLQQYANTDFQKMQMEDPFKAQQEWMRYQQLRDADGQVTEFLNNAQKTRTEQAERDTANRLKATAEFARKELKGWTPELDQKITEFAINELGFDVDTLSRAYNPQVYKTLYFAHLGHQTATARQNAPKPANITPPKPMTTVTPKGSTVTKSVGQMSVAEMDAYLNKKR